MSELPAPIRRAYELGRLRVAAPWALPPAVLAYLSCTCCVRRTVLVAMGVALASLLVLFVWRGGVLGAAAKTGLVGGLLAWLVPIVCPIPTACIAAGLVTGLAVGALARTRASRRLEFVLVASLVAALAGALGCLLVGLASVAAMGASLALGAVPVAFVPVRRSV
jgi:hypothetical protein